MKKFFLLALSLPLFSCRGYHIDTDRFQRDVNDVAAKTHTIVERDSDNYWLNNIRTYKTFPIRYYKEGSKLNTLTSNIEKTEMREYPRNVRMTANLGQRMLDSETFTTQSSSSSQPHYIVSEDGYINDALHEITLEEGQILYPLGEVKINGKYYIIFDPAENGRLLLADEHGIFIPTIGHIYKNELLISRSSPLIRPQGLKVTQSTKAEKFSSQPQMNYEIKYNGIQNNAISFIYSDYESGYSHEQTFIFPQTQGIANIRGHKFKIIKSSPNNIEYVILN